MEIDVNDLDIQLILNVDEARKMGQHMDGCHPFTFERCHFVINGVHIRKDLHLSFE